MLCLLTLLCLVFAGVHVGQSDVSVTQTLYALDHLAFLLPNHTDDLRGHIRAFLHEAKEGISQKTQHALLKREVQE